MFNKHGYLFCCPIKIDNLFYEKTDLSQNVDEVMFYEICKAIKNYPRLINNLDKGAKYYQSVKYYYDTLLGNKVSESVIPHEVCEPFILNAYEKLVKDKMLDNITGFGDFLVINNKIHLETCDKVFETFDEIQVKNFIERCVQNVSLDKYIPAKDVFCPRKNLLRNITLKLSKIKNKELYLKYSFCFLDSLSTEARGYYGLIVLDDKWDNSTESYYYLFCCCKNYLNLFVRKFKWELFTFDEKIEIFLELQKYEYLEIIFGKYFLLESLEMFSNNQEFLLIMELAKIINKTNNDVFVPKEKNVNGFSEFRNHFQYERFKVDKIFYCVRNLKEIYNCVLIKKKEEIKNSLEIKKKAILLRAKNKIISHYSEMINREINEIESKCEKSFKQTLNFEQYKLVNKF